MNTINPQSLKKLLLALGLSLFIIIIFLISRVFFQEDKALEHKSFKHSKTAPVQEEISIKQEKEKLLVLPSKE